MAPGALVPHSDCMTTPAGSAERRHRLMVVTAHPDDESLGFGGTIAKYAALGNEVTLVTFTRGERGRWQGIPPGDVRHPGAPALGRVREEELRRAAGVLGIARVDVWDCGDQQVDRMPQHEAVTRLADVIRGVRPEVVLTFGPDGAYGHPDHIAVSQWTSAAIVVAAGSTSPRGQSPAGAPHAVAKLYYLAWPASAWAAYQEAFTTLVSHVDGVARRAVPWPEWAVTTTIDTSDVASRVRDAVQCHASQVSGYERLWHLSQERLEALWNRQTFYRVLSTVNGGRTPESDIFEGLS